VSGGALRLDLRTLEDEAGFLAGLAALDLPETDACCRTEGSRIVNVDPWPTLLSTVIVPP
ncbi:hypothetical protein, partial [Methylobacterium oxalidis]|uniref:hypothetical protein n=1 Tax=Methylobacterium oxalidis TaxID=944322 RepID=UPI003314B9E7